ncbi:MAG: hypothetical protein KDA73_17555 [Rhodobacteraceae bacterium]|nr:hypothetical protein [Paracoccaceae bacterium]
MPADLFRLGDQEVRVLKRISADGVWERKMRFACLAPMAVAVWALSGLWLPILWLPVYFTVLQMNARLTEGLPPTVAGRRMALLAVALLADSLLFFAAVVYIAHQPDLLFQGLALFMLSGYMLNATTEHSEAPLLVAVDIVAVAVALVGITVVLSPALGIGGTAVLGVGAAILWLYFTLSVINTMQARRRLRTSLGALSESKVVETVGRLTGGLARDFGGHMTAVLGNLELAMHADDPKAQRVLLHEAHDSAQAAAELTTQLVAFSGRAHLRPVAVDLVTFLEEIRPRMRRLLPATVALEIEPYSTARMVFVDRRQLETVMAELVENARDAVGTSGSVRLVTRDLQRDEPLKRPGRVALPPGRYIRLEVIDTGSGIPESLLQQVHEPFFTTKRAVRAPGLGLSMAKGFAEQSGGALLIHSVPDEGTEITMLFPVHVHNRP